MKCYLCGNILLREQMIHGHIFSVCDNCKICLIKKNYIDSLIKQISKYYKFKNTRHIQIFLSRVLIANKDKEYQAINYNTKCQNISCRNNCDILKYKYNKFEFYYCNYSDYYLININKLEKFVYKQRKISLFYFYKEIIQKKLKGLFVKEQNGKE